VAPERQAERDQDERGRDDEPEPEAGERQCWIPASADPGAVSNDIPEGLYGKERDNKPYGYGF
jgi:hypothetical protein